MKKIPLPFRAASLAVGLALGTPAGADQTFDAHLATARHNLATEAGAAYDLALGQAVEKVPAVTQAMTACLRKHPGNHALQGYFHFTAPAAYTVMLAPAGPFAACLSKALEGQPLPAPPGVPYFNHFTFTVQ